MTLGIPVVPQRIDLKLISCLMLLRLEFLAVPINFPEPRIQMHKANKMGSFLLAVVLSFVGRFLIFIALQLLKYFYTEGGGAYERG